MNVGLKPVVHYDAKAPGTRIVLGESAIVWVLDHPKSPDKPDTAFTSTVIEIGERGVFQTRNTIYVPAELPPDILRAWVNDNMDLSDIDALFQSTPLKGEDHGL